MCRSYIYTYNVCITCVESAKKWNMKNAACTFREDPDIESETQIKCITLCN
jgi:hypothetical protein